MGRLRPWFELCRLPQALTVMADPLAGALIAGAGWGYLPVILILMLAAACVRAGAAALNDVHDYKSDLKEHPDRPLPSRRVGRWTALAVAIGLVAVGGLLTRVPGIETGQVGLLIVCTIAVHEFLLKNVPVAETVPSVYRALNLLLGMVLVPAAESSAPWPLRAYVLGALGLYVMGLMVFRHWSTGWAPARPVVGGTLVAALAVVGLSLLPLAFPERAGHPVAAIWTGCLIVTAGQAMLRAIVRPEPARIDRALSVASLGTIFLGAAAVTFIRGLPASLPVVLLFLPTFQANRWLGPPATSMPKSVSAPASAPPSQPVTPSSPPGPAAPAAEDKLSPVQTGSVDGRPGR